MKISDKIYSFRKTITDVEMWLSGDPNKIIRRHIRKEMFKALMKIINKI